MYLKRQKVPKNWPIQRKGTKYVVRANFNMKLGVPILIFLRDMLKVAQNRREVKKALNAKHILLNNRLVKNEKNSVLLFDVITITPAKKYYKLTLSKFGKFEAEEIKETEANEKVTKIMGKKVLKGKKTQLNLSDGSNFISNLDCKVNDSVLVDSKERKIKKCLPLKEKAKVILFAGKHSGIKGIINKINIERKIVELNVNNTMVNALIKQIMVTE